MDTSGIKIKSAALAKSNLLTNIASGWQEFWGPRGRTVIGSTVNNIQTSVIFGKPATLYVYAIIILTTSMIFIYFYIQSKNLKRSWQKCGALVLSTAFIFWALLETSAFINQYNQLKQDFKIYDFKTLEEKRALAVGADFYDFLIFCQKVIPAKAKARALFSGSNAAYYEHRSKSILYPIDLYSEPPEYIIVYQHEKDMHTLINEHKNYTLFKTYKKNAYILRRK
jgi:hypothetical protein